MSVWGATPRDEISELPVGAGAGINHPGAVDVLHCRAVRRDADRSEAALVNVLALVAALVGVVVSGRAVAAPLGAVGVLALFAAVVDARTRRIPNSVAAAVAVWVVLGVALVIVVDHRMVGDTAGDVLAGWLLSGAPFVALIWMLRPLAIGGGDLKLVSLMACAVGLLAPFAAGLILLATVIVALAQAIACRSRNVVLGPGLSLGYAVAVAAGVAANNLLGGRYS